MGEYECWNCNEIFELDEPPYDGFEICDECRAEVKEAYWRIKLGWVEQMNLCRGLTHTLLTAIRLVK